MDTAEKIRVLYTLTFITMIYIIWSLVSSVIFSNEVKYFLFIVFSLNIFSIRYMLQKKINFIVSFILSIGLSFLILSNVYSLEYGFINSLFILVGTGFLFSKLETNINYNQYKHQFTTGTYIIIVLSPLAALFFSGALDYLFRIYVIYVIFMILTIREAMAYEYNIKRTSKDNITNLTIIGVSLFLSQEFFYNTFIRMIKGVFYVINLILDKIAGVLAVIIGYPIGYILSKLKLKYKGNTSIFDKINIEEGENIFKNIQDDSIGKWANIIPLIFKIILVVVTVVIVIKIIKKYEGNKGERLEEYIEETETIDRVKDENKLVKKVKKLFRHKGDEREELIYNYKEFVEATDKKEIFRPYMTPTQLKNVTKINIKQVDNLDRLTKLYNKAKFSKNTITSKDQRNVEEIVKNIKEELK